MRRTVSDLAGALTCGAAAEAVFACTCGTAAAGAACTGGAAHKRAPATHNARPRNEMSRKRATKPRLLLSVMRAPWFPTAISKRTQADVALLLGVLARVRR